MIGHDSAELRREGGSERLPAVEADKINGSAAAAATVVDNCLDPPGRRLVNRHHGSVPLSHSSDSQQSTQGSSSQTWLRLMDYG